MLDSGILTSLVLVWFEQESECHSVSFSCVFQIHTIAIIAEGIPEALTRKIIKKADEQGVTVIGPATVRHQHWYLCISYTVWLYIY